MPMSAPLPIPGRTWRATLALDYERRGGRTVLAARRHDGPLVVQKPFYPEGEAVCHTVIVHPPGGIAGGDALTLTARAGARAHTLLTTPGAGKWYRSAGPWAHQHLAFAAGAGACLEWLPQETIVFDGARAELSTTVHLEGDACFIGWEILCLGRTGAGERFTQGACRARSVLHRDGKPLWLERGCLDGGDAALASSAVFAGQPVAATFIAAAPQIAGDVLTACREAAPATGAGAVTRLPGLLVGRYLGASSEAAKQYFTQLWRVLRPVLMGRQACEPRIWRT